MNQSPVPFARRTLKQVDEAGPGEHEFTVVTYNILADWSMQGREKYSYCPTEYKLRTQGRNSPRHILFMEELRWLNSDIICLQEVDTPYYKEMLADEMSRTGYNGLFAPRCMPGRPDGVAIFFKQAKFEVEETKTCYVKEQAAQAFKHGEFPECSDVVVVLAALRHKISNSLLVIGTTHISWNQLLKPINQVCEISFVTNALSDMVTLFETRGESVSHILCGDFNIEPQFPAYQLVREGRLNDEEMKTLKGVDYIRFKPEVEPPSQVFNCSC